MGGLDDISEPPPLPHLLLHTAAHNHPDGFMLGFLIPEHDSTGVNLGHTLPSPDRDLDLDLDLTSLSASAASGEGLVDWRRARSRWYERRWRGYSRWRVRGRREYRAVHAWQGQSQP